MFSRIKSIIPETILQLYRIIFRTPKVKELKYGRFTFLAPHEVLYEFASDLTAAIDDKKFAFDGSSVLVYVGIHHYFGLHWFRRGYKIGIQTEHIYDQSGKRIFEKIKDLCVTLQQALWFADAILDINSFSRNFYCDNFPQKQLIKTKIVFGPYIFPSKRAHSKPQSSIGLKPKFVFFGRLDGEENRRRKILSEISQKIDVNVLKNIYGDELKSVIQNYDGVLNIHSEDGVYSEAPRLLAGYLNGKVIVSEGLAVPFKPNEHYILLGGGEFCDLRDIFKNFEELVSVELSFVRALKALGVP